MGIPNETMKILRSHGKRRLGGLRIEHICFTAFRRPRIRVLGVCFSKLSNGNTLVTGVRPNVTFALTGPSGDNG